MNDWIIFALAVSQIVVLFWLSSRNLLAMINKIYLDKNVTWIRDNPAFFARFHNLNMPCSLCMLSARFGFLA